MTGITLVRNGLPDIPNVTGIKPVDNRFHVHSIGSGYHIVSKDQITRFEGDDMDTIEKFIQVIIS